MEFGFVNRIALAVIMLAALAMPATAQQSFGSTSQGLGQALASGNTIISTAPSDTTIRSVPSVFSPSVGGGANPCAVGVSAGVGIIGTGFNFGFNWSDPDCKARAWFGLLMETWVRTKDPQMLAVALAFACRSNDIIHDVAYAGMCNSAQTSAALAAAAPTASVAVATSVQVVQTSDIHPGCIGLPPAQMKACADNRRNTNSTKR